MARIERIDVLIQTGDVGGAGTDGDVYLGIAGREFFIDSDKDDFERGHPALIDLARIQT